MKVLHVIPSISPLLGGPSQVVLNLVKALRECGVDTEIVTTNHNGVDILDVPLYQRIEYEQVPTWFFPCFKPPMKEYIFSVGLTRWLWENIENYDLLDNHYLFSYASTCAGMIARWRGVPYTVRTMGQLSPWALAQSKLKKQLYTSLIERHNLNHANAIHCTSQGEVEDVQNFGITTPTINIPLGVNQPVNFPEAKQKLRAIYGISPQTPIILFISRIHYKKRLDLLIKALVDLKLENYDFHLLIAGSGEPQYITYLENLISELGLNSRTSWAGFVTGEAKNLLLQGSDIFVLPSFSENFGIAVAEAMAAGLPVIVTSGIQISPEIAQAQAGIVIEGEFDALKNAILQLLISPNIRRQLGENAKNLAKYRYSWNAIAKNLSCAYQAIINRQPLPENLVFNNSSQKSLFS